ncbi:MAG TPA: M20/M25/M40 family metallo-hydrolase [Clostridiales bacterium]|nr:MAG: putative succinyl-diaminopimelate desuccinylase [Firmicutes bacterium ADurb.Bin262]HOU11251.1 M20/M25/M40 family metallo-hydrolase [Clostridiales bacterium]
MGDAFLTVLYILLGLLAALIAVTLVRAAFFKPPKKDFGPLSPEKIDRARAEKNLSRAIAIETVSYPEDELVDWTKFAEFRDFLDEAYPLIKKNLTRETVAQASLIYRWKGSDPSLDAVALLAHQDVVPVSAGTLGDWTHPPFEGFNDGEYIWGRGALDMKNQLICIMETVEDLLAEGFQPLRDVYLCFGHNEEVVGSENAGAHAIMETLQERGVRLDCVLDEGGAILPVKVKGIIDKRLAGVGIAEKGYVDYEISVIEKGGHSSQPPAHTGVGKMADIVRALERHQFKAQFQPFLSDLFGKIGRNTSYPARLVACNVPILKPLLKTVMKKLPPAACMIRTTTAATMAQGSPAANVLPQKASVTVNFRQMPGTTMRDVEEHIRKVSPHKNIEIKRLKGKEASKFSPTDSRAFRTIEKLCVQANPDNIVAPYLVMGGTDACFYEPICDNIYRFAPFTVSPELLLCTHATDERIPVSTLGDAIGFFKRFLREMAGS